jgi:hypothetical protein
MNATDCPDCDGCVHREQRHGHIWCRVWLTFPKKRWPCRDRREPPKPVSEHDRRRQYEARVLLASVLAMAGPVTGRGRDW